MYVRRPLIMKYPVTLPDKDGLKTSIDAFLDLLISSNRDCFKADDDFGFSLEDFRFEIYNPDVGLFHGSNSRERRDILKSIEDPMNNCKIVGSSVNSGTFASDLRKTIVQYEKRLLNVEVSMDFMARGSILLISVNGIIDDGYDTPYTYLTKIRIW